jgi:PAS domain S-box-containing protein
LTPFGPFSTVAAGPGILGAPTFAPAQPSAERERLLASALATLIEPVFIIGLDHRTQYANAAAARAYGYAVNEMLGWSLWELRATERVLDRAAVEEALERDGAWSGESVHRRRDGSCFPVALACTLIRDETGQRLGFVVRVRDLTDEWRLAEQLRQTEKLAALGELVAGVAHEVNNPLTGISAFAQLLLEETMSDEQRDSIRLIKREADRAVGVIRDLLVFSRKTQSRAVPVDVNACLEQTIRLRAHGFRSSGIEVITDLDPALPAVRADEQRLQQVFLNLIVNAEHALQQRPERRLTVRTRTVDTWMEIEMCDTGVGMTPEVLAHIFEPFFTTKPEGTGTGLGLSVSYGIVHSHGGTLTAESAPGAGATFRVRLPLDPPSTGSAA